MEKILNQIVFFGSGPVAASSLEKLAKWANIEIVITKQRPPHHKYPAPVEVLAKQLNLNLQYANSKNQLNELISNLSPNSKLGLVIDYGVIISKQVIDYFPYGIINSHFSILPEWRGADPITYSLLSGQNKTGVTLMSIDEGLDTGPIVATKKINIENDTNQSLTRKLIEVSDELLKEQLPLFFEQKIYAKPQDTISNIATYSRMLTKADSAINPAKPATLLEREIRAFQGWPASKISINNLQVAITYAEVSEKSLSMGEFSITKYKLFLGCRIGSLEIVKLKPAGKKEMDVRSFINGYAYFINN